MASWGGSPRSTPSPRRLGQRGDTRASQWARHTPVACLRRHRSREARTHYRRSTPHDLCRAPSCPHGVCVTLLHVVAPCEGSARRHMLMPGALRRDAHRPGEGAAVMTWTRCQCRARRRNQCSVWHSSWMSWRPSSRSVWRSCSPSIAGGCVFSSGCHGVSQRSRVWPSHSSLLQGGAPQSQEEAAQAEERKLWVSRPTRCPYVLSYSRDSPPGPPRSSEPQRWRPC